MPDQTTEAQKMPDGRSITLTLNRNERAVLHNALQDALLVCEDWGHESILEDLPDLFNRVEKVPHG
jgi:hypothetical protein